MPFVFSKRDWPDPPNATVRIYLCPQCQKEYLGPKHDPEICVSCLEPRPRNEENKSLFELLDYLTEKAQAEEAKSTPLLGHIT